MRFSKQSLEGYLLIDHRNSPGVSAEFIQRSGKDAPAVPGGKMFEAATLTCAHCRTSFLRNPDRVRERGHCRKCDEYICDNPGCHFECVPFEKMLDDAQEQAFRKLNGGF